MEKRKLGKTGMEVSLLSFGASSLGAEFRDIDLEESLKSVRVALDRGMNLIDTSPYYGRGLSECLLRFVLNEVLPAKVTTCVPNWADILRLNLTFQRNGSGRA